MAQFSMNNLPINPFTNKPIPMGVNSRAFVGGRSLLDNIYGASNNPSIQANPPSNFRRSMMGNYGLMNDKFVRRNPTSLDTSQFQDPNVSDPMLRNYPALRKIPKDQRKFAKIVDGQVVFEYPEELETPDMSVPGVSNQPNIEQANKGGILNVEPKSNQENIEKANKGLLNTEEKPKMTMQGLLDKAVQFATSDFGRDFFMNIDDDYSTTPKSFLSRITDGYNVAKANEREREKLRIDELKTKNYNYKEPVYRALVRDKNGNQYGLFSSGGKLYADVNGKRIPQTELESVIGKYDIRNVGDQFDGVISFRDFRELNQNIIDDEKSLRKYVDFLQQVDTTGVGYERLIDNFTAKMKTFFSTKAKQYDLTEEELALQLANGKLQGLLGSSRKEVVGGGVLTEQDARRIIEYLGGDINAFSNPERVKDAISYIFKEKYRTYENNLNDYNIGVQNEYGTRGYKSKKAIEFTEPQLNLIDSGATTELGLTNFNELSLKELNKINTDNLSVEQLKLYLEALEGL